MKKRVWISFALILVMFAGITARLYDLSQGAAYPASQWQSSARQVIAVSRGTIYDRYLQPLVNREQKIVASLSPFQSVIEAVRGGLSPAEAAAILRQMQTTQPITAPLSVWLPPTIGVTQCAAPIRYETDGLAVHTIGYIDDTGHGITGIEAGYDERLRAYSGEASVVYQVDALGQIVEGGEQDYENTLSRAAGGIALTLDSDVQKIAQKAAAQLLKNGAIVISDVLSGQVLGTASAPTYEQANVESALHDAAAPLLDRTLINYDLGSVFKVIVATAALENGIDPRIEYICTGSYTAGGEIFHCHNLLGHGKQTMETALANSCNCYFYDLARRVGAKAIRETAVSFGFDQVLTAASGVETARALLPDAKTLSAPAALANLAIGQGNLMASPLHINAMIAAIANDGIWQMPSLYFGDVDEQGNIRTADPPSGIRVCSKATARQIRDMLAHAIRDGTGKAAAPVVGEAAGKTGTAQTGWEKDGKTVVQSWFAGFYPLDTPQYAITVLSENGGNNGYAAATVFAAICDELFSAGLVKMGK
ncbi:MAG: hypothetical protein IJU16_05995 [Clostridia bacterium]|nr:hypothetical protein [Clostridia bacterium]